MSLAENLSLTNKNMGLVKIEFPPFFIASLYKNSLVESKDTVAGVMPENQFNKAIQFLGDNKKGICLLVNYENDVYLPDYDLNFLVSILQACKLNLGDVAIINYHLQQNSFEQFRKQLNCNFLLVFGIDIVQLGLKQIAPFTLDQKNNCSIIVSPAIEKLNTNSTEAKLLKSKLWLCLKHLFDI
jgi:hypothetical protein